jgi:Cu/Ag efflux pump CusA
MSRPTIPPPPAGFSTEEIAAQVAAFQKGGGKIEIKEHGEIARTPTSMQAVHDVNWRAAAERSKAAGITGVDVKKRKRGPDLRLGTSKKKERQ